MVRKLKHHEAKLLKKVDLVGFRAESNIRVIEIMRRYHITKREDYTKCVVDLLAYRSHMIDTTSCVASVSVCMCCA